MYLIENPYLIHYSFKLKILNNLEKLDKSFTYKNINF